MNIEPGILKEINAHREREISEIKEKYGKLRFIFKDCESPLEQMFLYHVLDYRLYMTHCMAARDVNNRRCIICADWDIEDAPGFAMFIYPQHIVLETSGKVDGGERRKYRADFLFVLRYRFYISNQEQRELALSSKPEDKTRLFQGDEVASLVVEVDGHDYHERTKEQAKRDKSRDRYMTAAGYSIFRFTGAEVYRDTRQVVREVESFFEKKMSQVIKSRDMRTHYCHFLEM